jgi:hypothetical protein
MSALGNLIGVECAACRHVGHHCQAQIWDGDTPLCMRCADGEPCCFVTANNIETPRWLAEEFDPLDVLRVELPAMRRKSANIKTPTMSDDERRQIRMETKCSGLDKTARLHSLDPDVLRALLDEWNEYDLQAQERMVRMREEKIKFGWTMRSIECAVALWFGMERKDLMQRTRLPRIIEARQIAIYLMYEIGKKSLSEIGRNIGMDHTTVSYALHSIASKSEKDEKLRKNIEGLKAALMAA